MNQNEIVQEMLEDGALTEYQGDFLKELNDAVDGDLDFLNE